MTQVREVTGVEDDTRAEVLRSWLRWGAVLLGIALASQVVASLTDDKQDVRDAWLADTAFVLVASSVFGAIALAVAVRGAAGDRQRQSRTVVGLTVLAVVLSVVGWFTAAPTLTALAALVLGRATGVTDRDTGTGAARAASVVSTVVVLGVLVFTNATLAIESL
jgi:hypothetical protein